MNTKLQKRIEAESNKYMEEAIEMNNVVGDNLHYKDLKTCFIDAADFALQNQWISVEEALPEFEGNFSDYYLIRTDNGWCDVTMYYKTSKKEYWWNFEKVKVTHWMEIPSLEGGAK